MKKLATLCAGSIISILTAAHVHAASTDVDVVVKLLERTPALELAPKTSVSFGEVYVPNGTQPGNKCVYEIAGTATTTFRYSEVTGSGTTVPGTGTSYPSGCNMNSANAEAGRAGISCNPATPVTLNVSYTTGAQTGVILSQVTSLSPLLAAVDPDGDTARRTSTTTELTHTCPSGGAFDLLISGKITVDDTASATSSSASVGIVTVDATY